MDNIEVRTWMRQGRPQLDLTINAETEVTLTPDRADELARQLLWHAEFHRLQAKRLRGHSLPVVHAASAPDKVMALDCPMWIHGDMVVDRDMLRSAPSGFPRCAKCFTFDELTQG